MVEVSDLALLFNNEVATVLAALRGWAALSTRYAEDDVSITLLDDLEHLRRRIFSWRELGEVEPLRLLTPFFEVIRSPETGGPVTGTALGTLRRLISAGFFGLFDAGVVEAVNATAEAVTSCRFEATAPSADECVLFRMLEVLGALVTSSWGGLLSHDTLLNVLQAAYRIGHYQTEKGRATSDMLAHASRDTLSAMVASVFSRLSAQIREREDAALTDEQTVANDGPVSPSHHLVVDGDSALASGTGDADEPADTGAMAAEGGSSLVETEGENVEAPQPSIVSLVEPAGSVIKQEGTADNDQPTTNRDSVVSVATTREEEPAPCGIDTAREILSFVVTLISSSGTNGSSSGSSSSSSSLVGRHDLSLQGLHLLLVVLETGCVELLSRPELAGLLAGRLPRALFDAGTAAPPARLSALCSVALSMYVRLRGWAIVQVEALVRLLLLPLAEGKAGGPERQRIALECLLDFCRQPSFACDAYLAADCRVERADLLQEVCAALSKTAQPPGSPPELGTPAAVQSLALDALLALLCAMDGLVGDGSLIVGSFDDEGKGAHSSIEDGLELLEIPSVYVDIWTPLAAGLAPPTDQFLRRRDGMADKLEGGVRIGRQDEEQFGADEVDAEKKESDAFEQQLESKKQTLDNQDARLGETTVGIPASATHGRPADRARAEKRLKTLLASAAEHYNLDSKKGLQFAQSTRLLPRSLDAVTLGRYLRCCPGLNEAAVGEALGERDAFSGDVRAAYVATFDFQGLDFDVALRLFLDAFRLPGEGQKIDRIMEAFGKAYQEANPETGLRSADAAYVLAFSVIMLNTDLHKQRNDRQPRMTLEGFKRINDSTNDGEPMPAGLLEHLYEAISADRLTITADAETAHELPSVYWTKLGADAARASARLREELQRVTNKNYHTTKEYVGTSDEQRPGWSSKQSSWRRSGSFAVLDGYEDDGRSSGRKRGQSDQQEKDDDTSPRRASLYVTEAVIHDIYSLVCTPALAAAEAVLEGAAPSSLTEQRSSSAQAYVHAVRCALDTLRLIARGAARHGLGDLLDAAVVALGSAATGGVHVSRPAVAAWTAGDAGRGALRALGEVLATHGDDVRAPGWRAFAAALLRLHRAGLLPSGVLAADADDVEAARKRMPAVRESDRGGDGEKGGATSLLSRALNSLISVDANGAGVGSGPQSEKEAMLLRAASEAVDAAELPGIIADTKFLLADALIELLQALAFSAGDFAGLLSTGEPTDGAELCLELLFTVALRNRDRIGLIWPLLHEVIAAAVSASGEPNAVVRRATLGLLRVCERLLPSQLGADASLMRTLTLVLGLSPAVALQLAPSISTELLELLKSAGPFIDNEGDWKTICSIIRLTSVHPEAAPAAFECLRVAVHDPRMLAGASVGPLLEICQQLGERYRSHAGGELAIGFLSMEEHVLSWVVLVSEEKSKHDSAPDVDEEEVSSSVQQAGTTDNTTIAMKSKDLWWSALSHLAVGISRDGDLPALRDAKLLALQRVMLASTKSSFVDDELWGRGVGDLVLPVVENLAGQAVGGPRPGRPAAARSLRLAAGLLVKVLLATFGPLRSSGRFAILWPASLSALGGCMAVPDDAVRDSVPENVKNLLLVLATSGVLVPGWTEGGVDMWELTWSKAHDVSSGLNPNLLISAGLVASEQVVQEVDKNEHGDEVSSSPPREEPADTSEHQQPAGEPAPDVEAQAPSSPPVDPNQDLEHQEARVAQESASGCQQS